MVALKVEKADKSKKVLMFEHQVLNHLQGKFYIQLFLGLPNIAPIYGFVESDHPNGLNLIVMELLGSQYKKVFNRQELVRVKKAKRKGVFFSHCH